jgi:hypothetical protein
MDDTYNVKMGAAACPSKLNVSGCAALKELPHLLFCDGDEIVIQVEMTGGALRSDWSS